MLGELVSVKFIILYIFALPALYVHFRGRVRHRFVRQITDHSTFTAPYNSLMYLFSAVAARPFADVEEFPDLKPLQQNWTVIRDEAKELFEAGHIRASEKFNDIAFNTFFRRGWKRFYLKWYGDSLPSARALCPKTVELVESIPAVNAALFALLPPGGRLGEHRDPFAGSLRFHLGLMTPNTDKCRIVVDGVPYFWRDGEAVMFDETFIHSAANETDEPRIILFCDITRPLHTRVARAVNNFMIRHVVKATATRNEDTEPIGAVNHVSGYIYRLKQFFQSLKRANRPLYYTGKYILMGVAALWFLSLVVPFAR